MNCLWVYFEYVALGLVTPLSLIEALHYFLKRFAASVVSLHVEMTII